MKSLFQRILFCTDFSENADLAFSYALDAAVRRPGCVLYILHVIPEPDAQFWKTYIYEADEDVDGKARHDIDEKIAASYLSRIPAGLHVETAFRIGTDYREILAFASETGADLIVIGRQGHSSIGTLLFGSVTEKITRKAPCPILVVPLECAAPDTNMPMPAES